MDKSWVPIIVAAIGSSGVILSTWIKAQRPSTRRGHKMSSFEVALVSGSIGLLMGIGLSVFTNLDKIARCLALGF